MNLKDELLKLRKKITDNFQIEELSRRKTKKTITYITSHAKKEPPITYDLNDKVDAFIDWYTNNMIKGQYTEVGEYYLPREMRDFIEKVAVWYELRYPNYEINRLMPCSDDEPTEINKVMFHDNQYINNILDNTSEIQELEWNDFYNTKAFLNSLPYTEKFYFFKPTYDDIVYWNVNVNPAHLHLSKNGMVKMAEHMERVIPEISNEDLNNKNIKDVVKMIKDRGIEIPEDSEFIKAIDDYDKWNYQKEEMLNCIMYRIIERGGNRIGPRRAFLFAKEFNRNIDIPMMYGVDRSDPGLRLFINEYIKSGGSKNLDCYKEYFCRTSKEEIPDTISIQELLKTHNPYTPEETNLHQKFLNIIASQIDPDILKKEKIKELRIERKLEKSKKNL